MPKYAYSDQDIRNEIIELRDSLIANLKFMNECINTDLEMLKKYRDKFGDIRYRPQLGEADATGWARYGNPTEVVLEPLASKYRATINSLLQSIRLINAEILPEENPEGATAKSGDGDEAERSKERKAALRERFNREQEAAIEEEPVAPEEVVPTIELVKTTIIQPIKSNTPAIASAETDEPKSKPRPWRETTPTNAPKPQVKTLPATPTPPKEPSPMEKEQEENKAKARSGMDAVRARIGLSSTNRMESIKSKYLKRDDSQDD